MSWRESRRGCLRRAQPRGPGKESASARVVGGDSPAFFGHSTARMVTHPPPRAPWKLPQGPFLTTLEELEVVNGMERKLAQSPRLRLD
jgi:hypothetical protein